MKNQLVEMLNKLGNDAYISDYDNTLHIVFNDFDGFDEDWDEIIREYDNPSLVNEVMNFLEDNCSSQEDDFYTTYNFDNFKVIVGYTSYDI